MGIGNLSRQKKEELYVEKMRELQRRWKNPVPRDWDFDFTDCSDEQLDKMLEETIGQIRFEKGQDALSKAVVFTVIGFIVLGIIGLLVFGLRQLF